MEHILEEIKVLLHLVLKTHHDQLKQAESLSEREKKLAGERENLNLASDALKVREETVSPVENLALAQSELADAQQKLSEDRNSLEEEKRKQREFANVQNGEIAKSRENIEAEVIAIQATKNGMEDEIVRRVQELIDKIKK